MSSDLDLLERICERNCITIRVFSELTLARLLILLASKRRLLIEEGMHTDVMLNESNVY